jgi:hypothetical protein
MVSTASTQPIAPRPPRIYAVRQYLALHLVTLALLSACVSTPVYHAAPQRPAAQFAPLLGAQPNSGPNSGPNSRQCLINLGRSQANFTPLPDQVFGTGCSTINTVRLAWLRGDDAHLQLANMGPVTCSLASALEGWARFGVDRAARQMLGSPLARIDTFGSYSCRNIAGSDRRSGHATANAVDISAFVLADGHRIAVKAKWSEGTTAERNFLRVIRTSACRRFATVLTPDYNAAHQDHFHLEMGTNHLFCH